MSTSWRAQNPPNHRVLATTLIALVATLAAAGGALAQSVPKSDASVALYLQEAKGRINCINAKLYSCESEDTPLSGSLNTGYYCFLAVMNADARAGVAAMECSIEYDDSRRSGIDIDSWQICADLDFPSDDWPGRSGSQNRITWATDQSCQQNEPGGVGTGVTAVGGYFYLTAYSPDKLSIGKWYGQQAGGELRIADCGDGHSSGAEHELDPTHVGSVGFSDDGSVKGNLPCLRRVQEQTTWGNVKNLYNNGH